MTGRIAEGLVNGFNEGLFRKAPPEVVELHRLISSLPDNGTSDSAPIRKQISDITRRVGNRSALHSTSEKINKNLTNTRFLKVEIIPELESRMGTVQRLTIALPQAGKEMVSNLFSGSSSASSIKGEGGGSSSLSSFFGECMGLLGAVRGLSDTAFVGAGHSIVALLKQASELIAKNETSDPAALNTAAMVFDSGIDNLNRALEKKEGKASHFIAAFKTFYETAKDKMPPSLINQLELLSLSNPLSLEDDAAQIQSQIMQSLRLSNEQGVESDDPAFWKAEKDQAFNELEIIGRHYGTFSIALTMLEKFGLDSRALFKDERSFGAIMGRVLKDHPLPGTDVQGSARRKVIDRISKAFKNELHSVIKNHEDIPFFSRNLVGRLALFFVHKFSKYVAGSVNKIANGYFNAFEESVNSDQNYARYAEVFRIANQFFRRHELILTRFAKDPNAGVNLDDYIADFLSQKDPLRNGESADTIHGQVADKISENLPDFQVTSKVRQWMKSARDISSRDSVNSDSRHINGLLGALKWLFVGAPANILGALLHIPGLPLEFLFSKGVNFGIWLVVKHLDMVGLAMDDAVDHLHKQDYNRVKNLITLEILQEVKANIEMGGEGEENGDHLPNKLLKPIREALYQGARAIKLHGYAESPSQLSELVSNPATMLAKFEGALERQVIPEVAEKVGQIVSSACEKLLQPKELHRISSKVMQRVRDFLLEPDELLDDEGLRRRRIEDQNIEKQIERELDFLLKLPIDRLLKEKYTDLGRNQKKAAETQINWLSEQFLGPRGVIQTARDCMRDLKADTGNVDYWSPRFDTLIETLSLINNEINLQMHEEGPRGRNKLGTGARKELARIQKRILIPSHNLVTSAVEGRKLTGQIKMYHEIMGALDRLQKTGHLGQIDSTERLKVRLELLSSVMDSIMTLSPVPRELAAKLDDLKSDSVQLGRSRRTLERRLEALKFLESIDLTELTKAYDAYQRAKGPFRVNNPFGMASDEQKALENLNLELEKMRKQIESGSGLIDKETLLKDLNMIGVSGPKAAARSIKRLLLRDLEKFKYEGPAAIEYVLEQSKKQLLDLSNKVTLPQSFAKLVSDSTSYDALIQYYMSEAIDKRGVLKTVYRHLSESSDQLETAALGLTSQFIICDNILLNLRGDLNNLGKKLNEVAGIITGPGALEKLKSKRFTKELRPVLERMHQTQRRNPTPDESRFLDDIDIFKTNLSHIIETLGAIEKGDNNARLLPTLTGLLNNREEQIGRIKGNIFTIKEGLIEASAGVRELKALLAGDDPKINEIKEFANLRQTKKRLSRLEAGLRSMRSLSPDEELFKVQVQAAKIHLDTLIKSQGNVEALRNLLNIDLLKIFSDVAINYDNFSGIQSIPYLKFELFNMEPWIERLKNVIFGVLKERFKIGQDMADIPSVIKMGAQELMLGFVKNT